MAKTIRKISISARRRIKALNSRPAGKTELAVLAFYIVLTSCIAFFHEPWFDEAESWQIAKCASYFDIFFKVPHYEGHPATWYLILSVFAKTGCSYEISLKIVSVLIASVSAAFLIYKSPFLRLIRLVLPFTYFLFYQYAVIARPYGLMMFAFFLLASQWKTREEHPWHFFFALSFLAITSAYGILFSGSFVLVLLLENFREDGYRLRHFLSDRKQLVLMTEILVLLLLLIEILPRADSYALVKYESDNSPVLMFIYNLFGLPVESAYADSISYYALLNRYQFDTVILVLEIILGIFLWILMLYYARRKGLALLLVLPSVLFSLFCAFVYIYLHHTGLIYIFLIFFFWVGEDTPAVKLLPAESAERTEEQLPLENAERTEELLPAENAERTEELLPLENAERTEELLPLENAERTEELLPAESAEQEEGLLPEKKRKPAEKALPEAAGKAERRKTRLVRRLLYYCAALSIAISCTFSIISGINEVLEPYGYGRALAAFLKKYGLEDKRIMCNWQSPDTNEVSTGVTVLPYFQENIIYNVNDGEDSLAFDRHIITSDEQNEKNYEKWREGGIPDVLIGACDLKSLYPNGNIRMTDYVLVTRIKFNFIWKSSSIYGYIPVYVREDLADELGLYGMPDWSSILF